MKIIGNNDNGQSARVASALPVEKMTHLKNIECIGIVVTRGAGFSFYSSTDARYPNRPYLHLQAEVKEIACNLPFGITSLMFNSQAGMDMDIFYDFTNKQLADLAQKGLFDKGFKIPTVLSMNTQGIEIPIRCDFKIVHPVDEHDYPIVFAKIIDAHNVSIDYETCGYDMAEVFEYQVREKPSELVKDEEMIQANRVMVQEEPQVQSQEKTEFISFKDTIEQVKKKLTPTEVLTKDEEVLEQTRQQVTREAIQQEEENEKLWADFEPLM